MARSEHLAIYKSAYDLCLYFEQVVVGFARYHKYGIGADLRDGARRVLCLVVRANARADKLPVLLELREQAEELKVLLRLCYDTKALASMKSFEHAVKLVTEIAKQNEGWMKSQGRGRSRPAMPAGLAGRGTDRPGPARSAPDCIDRAVAAGESARRSVGRRRIGGIRNGRHLLVFCSLAALSDLPPG